MTIYPAGTTNFDYQGYGTLYDAYSAEVTEASSTNGNITETMEITYPVNGVLSDKMVEGNLVKAQISKTDGDYQIFEIDETEKSDNTVITAYLNAYPYRVLRMSFTNGGKFANFETLTRLLDYAKSYMPDLPTDFKITTNISNPINLAQTQTDPSLTPEPTVFKDFSSLLDAILNKVSGQVKFGPRSIEILAHCGQDKSNIELRDDKNTNGISVKVDTTNIVNKIIPLLPVKDKDGNSTSGTVVGNIVTPKDPFRFINFYSGQVVNVETQDLANSYFSRTNCNYPVTTATVTTSMIDEDLSDIRLFDIVSVYSSRINYTAKLKVSERVFDVLAGAVESFKLGTSSVNVFSTQTAAMNQVEQAVAIGNQALTSANGKNTNYYGDAKPTDGKEGDIWFHTVDGVSQMDQFSGGVWKTIVSDTFGKEVDKKVATAQAEASDAKTKAEEGIAKAESTAAKFDDTNQKAEQALNNSVSAQADALSAVSKSESTASEFGKVKQDTASALSAASSAVSKANSTASEFGKVKKNTDSALSAALNAQTDANSAVAQASSAAADSKDAKKIAGAVSQSYKTLTDGSTMTIAELQNGLAAKLTKTDLNEYATQDWTQNRIKITSDGINGTISSIKSTIDGHTTSINDLKADSSSFKSQFTTVNNTLGKQTSDISTLQASSKELTSGFNTLTTDNTTNKNDISQLKQTATEVSSTLETVRTQVKDSAVGINLAIGTNQEYAMGYGIPTTTWTDDYAYLKLPTNVINGEIVPQYQHAFWYTLTQGLTYTQTIWFETDANVKDLSAAHITWYTLAGHDSQPATIQKLGQNSYKVTSTYLWPGKSDNSVRLFDIQHLDYAFDLNTGTYLKFGKLKLEKGSLATDWCPNPADNASVTAFSELSQTVDGMKADMSKKIEQSDLNGYATQTWAQNQINTTANGINGTISSIKSTVDGHTTSINDLKADSSSFKAQFTNVNSTIGKHTADISTLQASSKELTSGFNTLTTDNTTNKNDISQLKQTSTEVSSTLETVQTQVQNSAVGTNLIVAKTITNYSTLGNGVPFGYALAFTTDYIPVVSNQKYTITIYGTTNSYASRIAYYDSSKNFISREHDRNISTSSSEVIVIPSGASYIRFSPNTPDESGKYEDNFKIEKGSLATDWCANPADNATVTAVSKISQTVDGMQTDISKKIEKTDLNGYATQTWTQTQIKMTADGINGTLSKVKSTVDGHTTSINDLKADSNGFKAQFTTVNNTIGKHTSDINTLQASSKELTSGFNTLTSDNKTNKNDISQLKQTSTEVSSTLETVQTQYNGIGQSQGRNYVRNSQFDSHMDNWHVTAGADILTIDTRQASQNTRGKMGLHIYGTTTDNFQGVIQSIPLKMTKGQKFVIGMLQSFDGYASEGKLHIGVQYCDSNGTILSQEWHDFNCDAGWNHIYGRNSFVFTAADDCSNVNLMICAPGPNYVLNAYITEVSLTVGPTSFGWQAAPEDLATVTEVSSISQTIDKIQGTIIDKADKSQITQLSDQMTSKISGLSSSTSSQITQLKDDISLRVEKAGVINAVNVSSEGIQIYGNKLHITANTFIDNAVIKDAMISNVSANKMTTGTLNAANVNVINLNGSNIVSNSITSNQLASGSVTADKIQSGAIRVSLNHSLQRLEIGVDGMNLMSDAGAIIGRIHSNHMNYDSTFWGLTFDMSANGGDFMAWGAQNNGDVNGLYQTKLAWYRWSTHGYDGGFHFQDRVEFHDTVEFRSEIDTRANYLLRFGSTNVRNYSSVPYLGLSGGASKIAFSPNSVWMIRHNNYYNMGAVIEGFSRYLGKAVFIPTGMRSDGRASSWTSVNIPSE